MENTGDDLEQSVSESYIKTSHCTEIVGYYANAVGILLWAKTNPDGWQVEVVTSTSCRYVKVHFNPQFESRYQRGKAIYEIWGTGLESEQYLTLKYRYC